MSQLGDLLVAAIFNPVNSLYYILSQQQRSTSQTDVSQVQVDPPTPPGEWLEFIGRFVRFSVSLLFVCLCFWLCFWLCFCLSVFLSLTRSLILRWDSAQSDASGWRSRRSSFPSPHHRRLGHLFLHLQHTEKQFSIQSKILFHMLVVRWGILVKLVRLM